MTKIVCTGTETARDRRKFLYSFNVTNAATFSECFVNNYFFDPGGSGAMWNMGQNETSLYFCMKQVLKLPPTEKNR
jgi:hypothetical protein